MGSLIAHSALEAPPMEVDHMVRLSPSEDLEFESRHAYTEVVPNTRAIGQLPAPFHMQARIEGALRDEPLSSGRPLEQSTEHAKATLFI